MAKSKKKSGGRLTNSEFEWSAFESEAIERLKNGEELGGKDGILAPMIKRLLEASLEGELDFHLKKEKGAGGSNRRNGKQKKGLKTQYGKIELESNRDRAGTFEPRIVGKRQTTLGEGLDNKIISMYGRGMSYDDIRAHLEELYGLEMSKGALSQITDKVLPVLDEWRNRPLASVYPIIWMDALVFKVRREGRIEKRAVYCVLGIDSDGMKDLLGLYVSENEGSKFWLAILTDLQNRGVEDTLIACIDNLSGFGDAIESTFPRTEVQLCVVHQIRNSLKYVTSEDEKPFLKDLRKVYQAGTRESAEYQLEELNKKWGEKYPVVIRSWRNNWERLSQYFKFGRHIRRIVYTTNTVEGFNRQLRKVTKSKSVFPNDRALLKMVFLASQNIMKKWTSPIPKWALVVQQLAIHFEGRLKLRLNMGEDL
ncbi:MAG: IS256 family transposase [Bacteroidota bacterium]